MKRLNTDLDNMYEDMNQSFGWNLQIVDGYVQLTSRIRNLDELLEYNKASIRYLSPFQFRREHVQFKGIPASVALGSIGLIVRHAAPYLTPRYIIPHGFRETALKRMDSLIRLYMERYNVYVGLLHDRSFFAYYRALKDPLSSPLALSICVDSIAYFNSQIKYSAQEKRDMAEFFYVRCRDILLDIYDDPKRRLEAVLSTILLVQYLHDVRLEYAVCRRLVTLALLTCHELEFEALPLIEHTLFQRARVNLQFCKGVTDAVIEEKFDFTKVDPYPTETLDDEPQSIKLYNITWASLLEFIKSPYITTIMENAGYSAVYGRPCELSLDLILQFEPTIQSWWKSLPAELRLCEDPFDLKSARAGIESVPTSVHLMPFAAIHVITAMIQSALLQPQATIADGNQDIIDILRERASSLTLCSTQALICTMKKNLEVDIEAIPVSLSYMMGVLHAVCNIVTCLEVELSQEMQNMLFYCFTQLHSIALFDHYIPESATILQSFVATCKSNPIEMYNRYPMPGVALLSDILHTCFRQFKATLNASL
ncbi:hypothetical protein BJV82DRAFT_239627 [Fennellomyces sp. T-0311]|nr:hypothetical protein BJV82DRAFT_239627 [Fennellomyces sp. T-0311]